MLKENKVEWKDKDYQTRIYFVGSLCTTRIILKSYTNRIMYLVVVLLNSIWKKGISWWNRYLVSIIKNISNQKLKGKTELLKIFQM